MDTPEGGDPTNTGYLYSYSPEDDGNPSVVITEVIQRITGKETNELEPLSNVINPEALNALFRYRPLWRSSTAANSDTPQNELQVEFEYEGFTISVTRETIRVTPQPSSQRGDGQLWT